MKAKMMASALLVTLTVLIGACYNPWDTSQNPAWMRAGCNKSDDMFACNLDPALSPFPCIGSLGCKPCGVQFCASDEFHADLKAQALLGWQIDTVDPRITCLDQGSPFSIGTKMPDFAVCYGKTEPEKCGEPGDVCDYQPGNPQSTCCEGLVCSDVADGVTTLCCAWWGSPCKTTADCCGQFNTTCTGGVCVNNCKGTGELCKDDTECCAGLGCYSNGICE